MKLMRLIACLMWIVVALCVAVLVMARGYLSWRSTGSAAGGAALRIPV